MSQVREFQVIGRKKPTTTDPSPKIYRMRLFAPNNIIAKSRFWYFMKKLNKVRGSQGEVLACNEITEQRPARVKNFGISLRYQSRTANHNIWKEFRDTSRVGAVNQLLGEMAGKHRVPYRMIQIFEVKEIKAAEAKRANVKQFHDARISFPLPHRVMKPSSRAHRAVFQARRTATHLG